MSITSFTLALLAVFAIPAAAHADTLTLSINGGPATVYILPNTPDFSNDGTDFGYFNLILLPGVEISFDNPVAYTGMGDGPLDFSIFVNGTQYDFEGASLYSGNESHPVLTPGIYDLAPASALGRTDAANLILSSGSAVTPEPFSLALLGTGLLGGVGMTRRRFTA